MLLGGTVACSGARGSFINDPDGATSPVDAEGDVPPGADVAPSVDVAPVIDVPSSQDLPAPPDAAPAVDVAPPRDVPEVLDDGTTCGSTYPAGPYGSAIGARFQPFALTACNRTGADATWRFDGPDFFTSAVTVVAIAAAWSVPDQRQTAMLQSQIADYYDGRGVRVVQVLAQGPDTAPANAAACSAWVARYGIRFPELIDPAFVTRPFAEAFPAVVLVDRCGRIRWRVYGADASLGALRAAIDDVLSSAPTP